MNCQKVAQPLSTSANLSWSYPFSTVTQEAKKKYSGQTGRETA